jgi:photosystem II stability/assembly factor-like uncharacterized protein
MSVVIGIGTVKGAWFASSHDRITWQLSGPHHRGWEVTTFGVAPGGDYLLATGSSWYGAAVHRSSDLEEWEQIVDGPAYAPNSDRKLDKIWSLAAAGKRLYAGVAEAGLFVSDDDGVHWDPVVGLNEHATRGGWQPGLGGLALHRLLVDPADPQRLWAAISAVGVFASVDGGVTWDLRNAGVEIAAPGDEHDIGYCVHCIVADPDDADRIWRQDHRGIYRTGDGGVTWERIEDGIPGAGFGFPIVRDPATGTLFVVPLESDEYRMPVDGDLAVYASRDGGDHWSSTSVGLRSEPTYVGVLRGAMDVDGLAAGGVYFGTTGGELWWSSDTGRSWNRMPATFPRITCVKVLTS